jgi:hypothetical protein
MTPPETPEAPTAAAAPRWERVLRDLIGPGWSPHQAAMAMIRNVADQSYGGGDEERLAEVAEIVAAVQLVLGEARRPG